MLKDSERKETNVVYIEERVRANRAGCFGGDLSIEGVNEERGVLGAAVEILPRIQFYTVFIYMCEYLNGALDLNRSRGEEGLPTT